MGKTKVKAEDDLHHFTHEATIGIVEDDSNLTAIGTCQSSKEMSMAYFHGGSPQRCSTMGNSCGLPPQG